MDASWPDLAPWWTMRVRRGVTLLLLLALQATCRRSHRDDARGEPAPADATLSGTVNETAGETATAVDLAADASDPLAELEDATFETAAGEARIVSMRVEPKGALGDVEAAVARGRFRFRACARPGDAGAGDVMLKIKVGEGGEVVSAAVGGHPAAACLRIAAEKLRFADPTGGAATVDLVLRVTW